MDTYTPANINTYISANMHPVVSNNALLILHIYIYIFKIITDQHWGPLEYQPPSPFVSLSLQGCCCVEFGVSLLHAHVHTIATMYVALI